MGWDVPKDAELLESVREDGVFLPVYFFEGEIIDGRKRMAAAEATAQDFERVDLEDERRAARLLWNLHPKRALLRFGSGRTLSQLCEFFGVRALSIIDARKALAPLPPQYDRTPEYRRQLHVRLDNEASARLNEMSKATNSRFGHVISAALLVANRDHVAAVLSERRNVLRPRKHDPPVRAHRSRR